MGLKRFDFKIKDNKKKKSIIAASIIVLVLLMGITIYATFAKYKVTKSYNLIQGQVSEFKNSDLSVAIKLISVEGTETVATDFPDYLEYSYLSDQSNCVNGSEIIFDEGQWSATISSSEKDKCTLYFEQRSTKTLKDTILANNNLVEETPNFNVATSDGEFGLYSAEDDYGTSYYFRGDVENNYVNLGTWKEATEEQYIVFGPDETYNTLDECKNNSYSLTCSSLGNSINDPMYWRIVRINGDGTIRLVYDGISQTTNNPTIASTAYNTDDDDPKYVGYTYEDENGIQVDSEIKKLVEKWYITNLESDVGHYLSDNIFCNDRTSTTNSFRSDGTPSLICADKNDKYTVKDTSLGNGLLSNPIGLLTADEIVMAGAWKNMSDVSSTSYLKVNALLYNYTMTPILDNTNIYMHISLADNEYVSSTSALNFESIRRRVRPVINLNANIKLYGSGTASDPYRLNK